MTGNPFDQGARYAAKLDPPGFLRWLLPGLTLSQTFHDWLDTRSIPFPGHPDRICDTVAAIREAARPPVWWAVPIEFQTRSDALLFGRLLEYLGRLWLELRSPSRGSGRFQVAAAVVNLTGAGNTSRDMMLGATSLRTCLGVVERNLRDEDAAATLTGIAAGQIARCLLPFIPLMRGGAEPGIIAEWKALAQAEFNVGRRSDYGGLALVFAELTDGRPLWKRALEGWNVEQSQQVLEWQAVAEKRGLVRGRAEAKVEALLRVLHKRTQEAVPTDVQEAIRATEDFDQLDRWLDAAAEASSLAEFRRLAGLEAKRNGRRRRGK
jgi:hypothetical protein